MAGVDTEEFQRICKEELKLLVKILHGEEDEQISRDAGDNLRAPSLCRANNRVPSKTSGDRPLTSCYVPCTITASRFVKAR
jgi:hypothetical protein